MIPLFVVLATLQQGGGRSTPPAQVPPATTRVLPAVVVWLADSNLTPGSRGRAFVRLREPGYLVLLRVDGEGRISVIFPAAPSDDARIPGGAAYEIPGPDGRAAFTVREAGGAGTVLAARAATPLDLAALGAGDRWDDHALLFEPTAGDAIAALLDIVDRVTDGRAYDADAATYAVTGTTTVAQDAGAAASTIFPVSRSQAPTAPPALLMMPTPGYAPAAAAPVTVNVDCSGAIISDGSACASVTYNAAPAAPAAVESYYQPVPQYNPYPYYDPFIYRNRQRRALRDTVTPAPKDHAIALTMRRPVMPAFRRPVPPPSEPTVTTSTPIVRIVTPASSAGVVVQTSPAAAAATAPATTSATTRLVPMRINVPGDGGRGRAPAPAAEPAAPSAPAATPSSGGTIAYPRAIPMRRPYRP